MLNTGSAHIAAPWCKYFSPYQPEWFSGTSSHKKIQEETIIDHQVDAGPRKQRELYSRNKMKTIKERPSINWQNVYHTSLRKRYAHKEWWLEASLVLFCRGKFWNAIKLEGFEGSHSSPRTQNQMAISCNQWFCLPTPEAQQTVLISAEGKSSEWWSTAANQAGGSSHMARAGNCQKAKVRLSEQSWMDTQKPVAKFRSALYIVHTACEGGRETHGEGEVHGKRWKKKTYSTPTWGHLPRNHRVSVSCCPARWRWLQCQSPCTQPMAAMSTHCFLSPVTVVGVCILKHICKSHVTAAVQGARCADRNRHVGDPWQWEGRNCQRISRWSQASSLPTHLC